MRASLLSILLLPICFGSARAQDVPQKDSAQAGSILKKDDRVRLTVDGRYWVIGEFQRLSAGQLELRPSDADSIAAFPVSSLTAVDVSGGTTNAALPGAILGVLGGGVAGFFTGVGLFRAFGPCTEPDPEDLCGFGAIQYILVGSAVGIGVGGFTGWAIGRNIEQERWLPVPLESVRVSLSGGSGFGLVVSLTPAR